MRITKTKTTDVLLIDKKTGEILDAEQYEELLKEEMQDEIKQLFWTLKNDPYSLTTDQIKYLIKITNSKAKDKLNVKIYEPFEYYSTHNMELLNKAVWELSSNAFICLNKLLKYSNSKNTLQFANHRNIVNDVDFIELLKVSKRTWSNVKKELIEYGAIRKIKFNKNTLYKLNPTIIGHSMEIDEVTYYAFRDVLSKIFEPLKTLYWDKYILECYGMDIFCTNPQAKLDFYSAYFNAEDLKRRVASEG